MNDYYSMFNKCVFVATNFSIGLYVLEGVECISKLLIITEAYKQRVYTGKRLRKMKLNVSMLWRICSIIFAGRSTWLCN